MKGWHMYSEIQALKEKGFSIRMVSRLIRVRRNTIRKYWDMPPDEYAATLTCINKLSAYEPPVRDWLCEKYHVDAVERTVRRFNLPAKVFIYNSMLLQRFPAL